MSNHGDRQTVVLASGNAGKLREFADIFATLGMQLRPQGEFGVTDVAETGLSFVENAIIKARAAAEASGHAALADDSGLAVDYLNGEPGIHSARYSGGGDAANNARLLEALAGVPDALRGARFHCALVFMRHALDPCPLVCQASWEGRILQAPRGEQGFGYDPLFYVPEYQCSSAELPREVKNRVSHRARASALLLEALKHP